MSPFAVFMTQIGVSLLAYALVARWYLWGWLARVPLATALTALLWIHVLRTLGLTVLVPGVTDPSLPARFAEGLAYGDLAAAVLALGSIVALRTGSAVAVPLVWVFTFVGVLDLANVTIQGLAAGVVDFDLGAVWFIPTYFVPALWVSHVLIVTLLLRRRRAATP